MNQLKNYVFLYYVCQKKNLYNEVSHGQSILKFQKIKNKSIYKVSKNNCKNQLKKSNFFLNTAFVQNYKFIVKIMNFLC